MDSTRLIALLENRVPGPALDYCVSLWNQHPFEFKLRRSRSSKVGDFTCRPGHVPRITVNIDSHPFLFLVTYVHEVAHLDVHRNSGFHAEAHGAKWKEAFRTLMRPLMTTDVFPADLLLALETHMVNPKASSFSDSALSACLRQYDERQRAATRVSEIPEGSIFRIRSRWFKKGNLKRTRAVCREIKTSRQFLVPLDANVDAVQLSFL